MAKVRFTDKGIRSLSTNHKQEDFYDLGFGGTGSLILRLSSGGRKTWVYAYRLPSGRRGRVSLGTYPALGLSAARQKALEMSLNASQGIDPRSLSISSMPNFANLSDDYLERHAKPKKSPKSLKEDRRIINAYLLPAWGRWRVDEIQRGDVIKLLDGIAGRAPVMANRVRSLVHKIFEFAADKALVPEDYINPCHRVKPLHDEKPKNRVLTNKEIKSLWAELVSVQIGASL